MTVRQEIIKLIQQVSGASPEKIEIDHPQEKKCGDYSTNIALRLKTDPEKLSSKLKAKKSKLFERIETAEPGFINFFISKEYLQNQVKEILKNKNRFGELKIGRDKKVNVEFISANPTGPLTLGNGRGGFCGDVLANVLQKAGFKVEREYYVNDIGEQVKKLGHSVLGDSQAVYSGNYIAYLRKKIRKGQAQEVGEKAAKIVLKEMIKPTVRKMRIQFDNWFSEKALYQKKETEKTLDFLKKKRLLYEKEGAFWFKSSEFGDDKDRVLLKADGQPTYFLSDIAYLKNKINRGFKILFFFWGADHFGYVNRIKAAAEVFGFGKNNVNIIIMQLVRLVRQGKEMKMAKRSGIYVTLDELIGEVGLDAARFFFLSRAPSSHLNFDLDLAKERSEKNPVYYVQYAHARICSILRKSPVIKPRASSLKSLNHPSELALIKQLIRFPEIIEDTVKDYQVQRLPQYATHLATAFHQFYRDCRVLTRSRPLSEARLALLLASQIVLKNTLSLMGISLPQKM
jgi:arginyl-tRNA synthetase